MWRVGVLYRVPDMLLILKEKHLSSRQIKKEFPRYRGVDTGVLLGVLVKAGWVEHDDQGIVLVSSSGNELISISCPYERLRVQLRTLIERLTPSWAAAAVQGRGAFAKYLPPEVAQCFRECGLLDGQDPAVVAWWDSLAARYRYEKNNALMETGREGERLTYAYEARRTGAKPYWIALEYSGAGYDLLSRISATQPSKLLIEVKASRLDWDYASFHISRYEWDVLSSANSAEVHLWSFGTGDGTHAVVPVANIEAHIPVEQGSGRWESVELPFSMFAEFILTPV